MLWKLYISIDHRKPALDISHRARPCTSLGPAAPLSSHPRLMQLHLPCPLLRPLVRALAPCLTLWLTALVASLASAQSPELSIEYQGIDLSSNVTAWGYGYGGATNVPASLTDVIAVSGGDQHSLALKADGTVIAWGRNTAGQATVPAGLTNVISIAAGMYHSLALKADGTVVMWGDDNHGAYAVPAGLSDVKQIATGYMHSLALKQDGTVVGWGENLSGQRTIPPGLTNVISIAAGSSHSLALKGDGTVIGWGSDTSGQATPPAGLQGVVAISAGAFFSLALKADGSVVAWGSNSSGQATVPSGLSGVSAIAAGAFHSVAMKNDGTLVAWGGDNFYRQTQIPATLGTVTRIEAGSNHTLAIGCTSVGFGSQQRAITSAAKTFTLHNTGDAALTIATVLVSGDNASDFSVNMTGMSSTVAAGASTTFSVNFTPSVVGARTTTLMIVNTDSDEFYTHIPLTGTGIAQVPTVINPMHAHVTGYTASLGGNVFSQDDDPVTERGVVICATSVNSDPHIGDAGVVKVPASGGRGAFWTLVDRLVESTSYTFKAYATNISGTGYSSARTFTTTNARARIQMAGFGGEPYGGTVKTWGDHSFGQISGSPTEPNVTALASGAVHSVALLSSGLVRAWGDNSFAGQTNVPATLSNVTAIAAGAYFTLALKGDGTVVRWGSESNAGLTPPADLSDVIAIAAGDYHGLALKSDGTVVQWPADNTKPANLSGVIGIAAGSGHSLVLLGDGTVIGWGNNSVGQLAIPSDLSDVTAIAARGVSSLALKRDGTVVAWGGNAHGESSVPSGTINVAGIGTGDRTSFAYTRDGSFIGWGDDTDGKITPPPGLSHVIGITGGSYHTSVIRRELPSGTIGLGSTSGTTEFIIRNRGDSDLSLVQWQFLGSNPNDFTLNITPSVSSLAPNQQSVVQINFRPTSPGFRTAILRIKTNDPDTPNFDILLTGTGVVQAPLISDPTVSSISHHSAVLGATVSHTGGAAITQRGVVLSLASRNAEPATGGVGVMTLTTSGSLGVFTLSTSSLLMNREYAMRGFATNAAGTHYTDVITFTTPQTALPEIAVEQPAGTPVSSPVVGRGYNDIAKFDPVPALPGIVSIGAGDSHTLALTQAGKIIVWGDNPDGQTDVPEELTNVIAVSAGAYHSLALNRDGVAFAWGRNWEGEGAVPAGINGDIIAIAAGRFHNIVLHSNGTVSGWGSDWVGQASPPAGLTNVIAIAAGGAVSAALKNDGTVVTWGQGIEASVEPPAGLTGVTAIAAGLGHVLALKGDGTVVAWGLNDAGQTDVHEGLSDVVAIDADFQFSLARRADGTVVGWGNNDFGQLNIPSDHPGYQSVASGPYHSYTVDTMIDFGSVSLGSTTATKTFTIRNTGDADLHLIEASIIGTNSTDFIIVPPSATTIEPASSATISVTFSPAATGYRSASLHIVSDDVDESTLDITLEGTGIIGPPNVIKQLSNSITKTSATVGGIVTSDGGAAITERGIVFSISATNNDPLISGTSVTQITSTGTTGSFTINLTNLTPNTAYVFKAYATNSTGTAYSSAGTFTTLPEPLVGVGNLVFWDKNANGHADTGEGIDGVTVQLFTSTQDPLADTPLQSTTTVNGGLWLIDQLHEGSYRLFIPPAMFASGAPLYHLESMTGVLPGGDDNDGEKGEDSLTPETLGVRTGIITLVAGALPISDQELGQQGSSDDAHDDSTDLTQDFGFIDVTDTPATFAQWKQQHGITGQGNGNADHDAHDDLFEYALGTSGSNDSAQFTVDDQHQTGQTNIVLRRRHGSQSDIVFKVQVCPDLSGAQGGWTATTITPVITVNTDGTETLTFPNVTTDPALTGSSFGFTRLIIELDADHNGTPELTTSSDILGWQHRALAVRNQTYGLAFVRPAIFTAIADGISGSTLDLSTAVGSTDLRTLFIAGEQYYAEVITGDNEGQRYEVDEAASTATTIALLLNDSLSTQTTINANITGDTIAIRPHWRVKDLFPPVEYHGSTIIGNADQLLIWNPSTNGYTTLFLLQHPVNGPVWMNATNLAAGSQNNRIMPPAEAMITKPRQSVIAAANGQVRTWKFACPLRQGINLISNPFPVAQSLTDRLMTVANGFTVGNSLLTADRVLTWKGDASSQEAYDTFSLIGTSTFNVWGKSGVSFSTNFATTKIFNVGVGCFIVSQHGHSTWVMPAAVAP